MLGYVLLFAGTLAPLAGHGQDMSERGGASPVDQARAEAKALRTHAAPRKRAAPASSPAQPADLLPGAPLRDVAGVALGAIELVRQGGVVIASKLGKIEVEPGAIRRDAKGLFLVIPKARFDALVTEARARREGSAAAKP